MCFRLDKLEDLEFIIYMLALGYLQLPAKCHKRTKKCSVDLH